MGTKQQPINFYAILGVAPSATTEEIRAAYRARIAHYHPDRNPSTHANAITALVNEAWEVLGNPERRRQYDPTMGVNEWNTSNITPPTSPSRPQPNGAVRQSTSPALTWSVRILWFLFVGAGVTFAWLTDLAGNPYKGWTSLLFWVCFLSAIYCFRKSPEFFRRLFRWPVILFRWYLIAGSLLYCGVLTFLAFTEKDITRRVIFGALAIAAVCFADYLSGQRMARAVARWLGGALIRLGAILDALINRNPGRIQQEAMAQAQAVQERRTAAEQGNAIAQYNLGVHYAEGQGVPQDYRQAVHWWSKAAEQGDADAHFNLGVAYANGWGVPQDFVEAHKWMNLAAARTSSADQEPFAADGRDAVAKKMTPDQLSEAQKRAREWTEAFERGNSQEEAVTEEEFQEWLAVANAQIANARNVWGKLYDDDYNLGERSEVLKFMRENPSVPFEEVLAQVLGPKAHQREG